MTQPTKPSKSRREFLSTSGAVAAATTLAGIIVPRVHAGEENELRLALIGCGGRGTGATVNAFSVKGVPVKLVAMADVFEDRLSQSLSLLQTNNADRLDVPETRRFIGFDAYRDAMDSLRPGDIAILATPPAFRWVHFTYAIERGLNVFMEKPVTVDGPTSRRMFDLADLADQKNLKVGVGLMCRHCDARRELFDRIQNGEIGDLITLQAYRMSGPIGSAFSDQRPAEMSEVEFQIRRFHSFLWASGGCFNDFLIHNTDEACWMKDDFPVRARACGGRHYRGESIDQNFDTYSVEYDFADGTKIFLNGRNIGGCKPLFATYAHGTKGSAVVSTSGHIPAKSRIYKGHNFVKDDLVWHFSGPEPNPYDLEWQYLIDAIRQDTPYSEVRRGVEASLACNMGRMAAHTGKEITRDQILNHEHEFAPDLEQLTLDGPAPVSADENGQYPVPMPGLVTDREYDA